jgi:DNA-binding PadR family transcriptional regulator
MDVKTLCLGVLCHGEATGYDIKKHFESAFSHFFLAGYGSIYPALAELTERGLVLCEEQAQPGRPDRKVYRITEAGSAAFRDALCCTEPRHKVRSEFLVLLYFAQLMPPERLSEVLDQRLGEIEDTLGQLDTVERLEGDAWSAGEKFVAGFGRAVLEASRDYVRDHRHQVEEPTTRAGATVEDAPTPVNGALDNGIPGDDSPDAGTGPIESLTQPAGRSSGRPHQGQRP